MAETVVLLLEDRSDSGTRKARKLRTRGKVPAVVYGHQEKTVSVAVSADELSKAIRQGARIVDLKQGENLQKALIRELQWDALGADILHVDFARVSADERVTLEVRIELRGTAPGVTAGGALVQLLHNLVVECPVIAIPESIRVHIGKLEIDQSIHVRDLVLPEGVTTKAAPDAIVVQVAPPVVEEEVAPAAAVEGESAEPEVIGRQKAEEGAEEEAE